MNPHPAVIAATAAFLAACVVSDVRTRRIPNVLTGGAVLVGAGINLALSGWAGAYASLTGLGLATLLLLGPFALGGIGGGDVKMMAAVGALLGPSLLLKSLCVGLILGGVVAVGHLLRADRLREKLSLLGHMLSNAALSRSTAPLKVSPSGPNAVALPYSVPLGIGTAAVIALSVLPRS
jgi:prepilin peptidase CpaA